MVVVVVVVILFGGCCCCFRLRSLIPFPIFGACHFGSEHDKIQFARSLPGNKKERKKKGREKRKIKKEKKRKEKKRKEKKRKEKKRTNELVPQKKNSHVNMHTYHHHLFSFLFFFNLPFLFSFRIFCRIQPLYDFLYFW